MSFAEIIGSFVVYSVLGWGIDTAWRSIKKRRYARGGFSRYPFSPIYGFGALLALGAMTYLVERPLWQQWLAFALLLCAFEYVGGALVLRVLKRRLWNYSASSVDIEGHTTPWHGIVWGLLALLLVHVLHPFLLARFSFFTSP